MELVKTNIELDLEVAEKVMGWQWQDIPKHVHIVGGAAVKDNDKVLMPPNATFPPYFKGQDQLFYQADVPRYSSLLKDCWDVVDKLWETWTHYGVDFDSGLYTIYFPNKVTISENSFPLVICKGALATLEKENASTTTQP